MYTVDQLFFKLNSLHFNGHFPGEHGLAGFIGAKDGRAKLQSNRHHQQTNTQLITDPPCRPTNSVKAVKRNFVSRSFGKDQSVVIFV